MVVGTYVHATLPAIGKRSLRRYVLSFILRARGRKRVAIRKTAENLDL